MIKTELWDTVVRRGVLGNLFMGLIPMVFYLWVNAVAFCLEKAWILLGRPDVPVRVRNGKLVLV